MNTSPQDRPQTERSTDSAAPQTPTMGTADTPEQQMPTTDLTPSRNRNLAYVAGCLIAAAAGVGGGVVLLTGGDNQPIARKATPPVTTSATPAPTVTSSPTPEDIAAAAAKATYLEYVRVDDQVAQGGYKNLTVYDAVAVSPERTELALAARRLAGIRTTGSSEVASLVVTSVSLTTDPAKSFSEVRLRACLDVQKVRAFRADGTSAVAANRLPRIAVNVLGRVSKVTTGAT
jgi:hypothetical protein